MPVTVENPIFKVSERLSEAVREQVGDEFYTDLNDTIANFPAVRLLYLGGPNAGGDIEGDECAINASFQVESFAKGQGVEAQKKAWELDSVCHQAMTDMFFRRTYNNLVETENSNVKRVVSRYSRIYTGQL